MYRNALVWETYLIMKTELFSDRQARDKVPRCSPKQSPKDVLYSGDFFILLDGIENIALSMKMVNLVRDIVYLRYKPGNSGKGEDIRKGCRRVNVVEILCTRV
jgi:hypothetical protein